MELPLRLSVRLHSGLHRAALSRWRGVLRRPDLRAGFYGNDSWKATPHLTVNVGLRYEYQTVPYSETLQTVNAISNVPGLIVFQEPTAMNRMRESSCRPGVFAGYQRQDLHPRRVRPQFRCAGGQLRPARPASTGHHHGGRDGRQRGAGSWPAAAFRRTLQRAALTQAEARAGTGGYVPNQTRPESLQWNIGIQRVIHENYTVESALPGHARHSPAGAGSS